MIKWSSHFNTIVLSLQPLICHKIVFLYLYNTTGDIERVELFSTQDKAMTSSRRRRLVFSMQLQMENNDTSENGQGEQRPNEGTIIVGDSIVKGLRRDLLSRAAKQRVTVRSFPGATTADMEHYLQPSLAKKPKAIILHVGTNDLKTSSSARNVAEKIVDLGNIIATNSPNTSVTISAITQRSDEESLKIKVKDCNKVLRTFCNQNGWGFVEHLNIDETCLNNHKLHLNKKGIASYLFFIYS